MQAKNSGKPSIAKLSSVQSAGPSAKSSAAAGGQAAKGSTLAGGPAAKGSTTAGPASKDSIAAGSCSTRGNAELNLYDWAVKRMKLKPDSEICRLLSSENCNKLMRDERLKEIWRYVTSHLHHRDTVKRVKYDLTQHAQQRGRSGYVDREELIERKNQLLAELRVNQTAVLKIEAELQQKRQRIANAESERRMKTKLCISQRERKSLMTVYRSNIDLQINRGQEFNRRINDLHRKEENRAENRNECERSVSEVCENVEKFLLDYLNDCTNTETTASSSQHRSSVEERREGVWNETERLMQTYTREQLMRALCTHMNTRAVRLSHITAAIDIAADIQQLKFRNSVDGSTFLEDLSFPVTTVQTVRQLLEEHDSLLVESFVEAERARNSSHSLQPRLNAAVHMVNSLITQQMSNKPENIAQLCRQMIEKEASVAQASACVRLLERESEGIEREIERAKSKRDQLINKYNQIQSFKQLVEKKQSLIRVLVRQNAESCELLKQKQIQARESARRTLCGRGHVGEGDSSTISLDKTSEGEREMSVERVRERSDRLKNSVSTEMRLLVTIPLLELHQIITCHSEGPTQSPWGLSIHRLQGDWEWFNYNNNKNHNTGSGESCHALQKTLISLQYSQYLAADGLLEYIVKRWSTCSTSQLSTDSADQHANLIKRVSDLCARCNEMDESQINKLLPQLSLSQSQATESLTACLRIKDLVSDWWSQPAQSCCPWMKVDGRSLEQWKRAWCVISIKNH